MRVFLKGKYMNKSFLKFKRKLMAQRVARSIMLGDAAGMALGGAALFLSKRELVGFEPLISLIIGLGGAILVGLIVFLLGRRSDKSIAEELDKKFPKEAAAAGFVNLKGHRSVGGMRASIYNAMPVEGVEKLVAFMKDFAAKNPK